MIQRLQSIFLLAAAGFFGGNFFTSFASSDEVVNGIFSDKVYTIQDNPMLMILACVGGIAALISIFLYQNRKLQLKISYLIITAAILLPLIAVLIYSNQTQGLQNIMVEDELGLYLPIGAIAFTALAIRYIRKDDNLVKSMDRLR